MKVRETFENLNTIKNFSRWERSRRFPHTIRLEYTTKKE